VHPEPSARGSTENRDGVPGSIVTSLFLRMCGHGFGGVAR
jgi:hypothetical protein